MGGSSLAVKIIKLCAQTNTRGLSAVDEPGAWATPENWPAWRKKPRNRPGRRKRFNISGRGEEGDGATYSTFLADGVRTSRRDAPCGRHESHLCEMFHKLDLPGLGMPLNCPHA